MPTLSKSEREYYASRAKEDEWLAHRRRVSSLGRPLVLPPSRRTSKHPVVGETGLKGGIKLIDMKNHPVKREAEFIY